MAESKNQTMHPHSRLEREEMWRAWAGIPIPPCVLSHKPEKREKTRYKEDNR